METVYSYILMICSMDMCIVLYRVYDGDENERLLKSASGVARGGLRGL